MKEVNLKFPKQGMVFVLGKSGSGKSTLLNIIGGLDYAQAELFVDSDGTSANYPHYYRKAEAKIAKEKRKLSRMQMKSNN